MGESTAKLPTLTERLRAARARGDEREAAELRDRLLSAPLDQAIRWSRRSQHCRTFSLHAQCPRETTLGTGPCECDCHQPEHVS